MLGLLLAVLLCVGSASAQAQRSPQPKALEGELQVTTVAKGLDHPWGIELLPDGALLVTERAGRLRMVTADGRISQPLTGVPKVFANGQGGLLDVVLSPNFAQDRLIYFSYAEPGEGGAGTAVARGRLGEGLVDAVQIIWRQAPKVQGPNHFGSRLAFARDGNLFVTLGDRFKYRDQAQNLANTLGKVVRIQPDGTIPKGNPFVGRDGVKPEIWSYGHRNVQAATIHPETGQLWTVEHGARGGDELNHPQAGKNYGWPVITYGVDYSGAKIGEGTSKPSMEQPVYYWDPVIAPSGALFYTGKALPQWRGNLLIGSLQPGLLVRLEMAGDRVNNEARYLGDLKERVRDVQQAPDGSLYLITDDS
ncbi:MAG TPA: PQQ-dependent sugar dehydrogenase, partial [Candidatus Binatia bacterium]|nr:PQQ-dependent sugar dehydrogenase [Candidatus Binatia bacterium]